MIDAADGSLYNGRRKIAVRKERYMDSILLLEDEESVSRGIAFTLEREGYTVYTASSVAEARALYESRQPQFVIAALTLRLYASGRKRAGFYSGYTHAGR